MSNYKDTLINLLPPVSYDKQGKYINIQATVDGNALDAINDHAGQVTDAITPRNAGDMLTDWERVLGLTGTGKPYQQRLSAVLAKINATGGLSIPYFTRLAQAAGYEITITEPQPFRAGVNRAGDQLAIEDIIYTWRVNVKGSSQTIWRFRAGASAAGDKLSDYSDSVIESVIQDLKPAHTWVGFAYGADDGTN